LQSDTAPPQNENADQFDELFAENVDKPLTYYFRSGKAACGVLRSYDKTSIRFDGRGGAVGGTSAKREDLVMVTVGDATRR